MTDLTWQELANALQARIEARCEEDGHSWEVFDTGRACRWCLAISESAPIAEAAA